YDLKFDGGSSRKIEHILKQGDEVFAPTEETARTIIVTTLATWNRRHGPSALYKFRTQQYGKEFAEANRTVEDPDWPCDLRGCFETTVLDEAHMIRNVDTFLNLAILWLRSSWIILMTATPLVNGPNDILGYLQLIQSTEDNQMIAANKGCQDPRMAKDTNPFTLPDSDPASRFRLTVFAFSKFILERKKISPTERGLYMGKLFEKFLIRRNYRSACPFGSANTIGRELPPLRNIVLNLVWDAHAMECYQEFAAYHNKYLRMPLYDETRAGVANDNQFVYNAQHFRALTILSTWPPLGAIPEAIYPHGVSSKAKSGPEAVVEDVGADAVVKPDLNGGEPKEVEYKPGTAAYTRDQAYDMTQQAETKGLGEKVRLHLTLRSLRGVFWKPFPK
ncbi:hypothetical protein K432DRAFT_115157, partial [Lepidopterella palustris CBS 459.81]